MALVFVQQRGRIYSHDTTMKCLSIRQPWAMLILAGHKRFETRGWGTVHRGPLAIHAARYLGEETLQFCQRPWVRVLLRNAGYASVVDLPRGQVLGVVELIDCVSLPAQDLELSARDRQLGDFRPGNFAWRLCEPQLLENPQQFTGKLGLFDIPDSFALETRRV